MKTLDFNLKTVSVKYIAETTDLKNFKTLVDLNRKTNKSHVNHIKESFERFGTASATIIVIETKCFGDTEYYVADGQHRRLAAIEMGLPLNVNIVRLEEDTKKHLMQFISELNNTSKGWNNAQYMTSFAHCDIPAYIDLKEITKESGLKTTDLQFIFLENNSQLIKDYKKGKLTVLPNKALNMQFYNAVMKVIKLIPNKAYTRRALYRSMRLADNFDKLAVGIIRAARLMKEAEQTFSENETEFFNHIERIRVKTK